MVGLNHVRILVAVLCAFRRSGALAILFAGRWLSQKVVGWIASAAVLGAFLVAVTLVPGAAQPAGGSAQYHHHLVAVDHDWRLRDSRGGALRPAERGDGAVVTGVGCADPHLFHRLHGSRAALSAILLLLNFFILAMLTLVMSNNFLAMFVGWEGVGLASFLLIGFWFERRDDQYGWYADAGKKAFLVNRVGDAAYLIAMFIIWTSVGSLILRTWRARRRRAADHRR
jgi:NADH-quinone oxidoreductase subunit L